MELDQELRDTIVTTAANVENICKQIEENRKTSAEHDGRIRKIESICKQVDADRKTSAEHTVRIRKIEENQSFLAGKITILTMGVGMTVLVIVNYLMNLIR